MCGRFVGFSGMAELVERFPIDVADVDAVSSYNVAPTQEILVIIRRDGQNRLQRFHWGLVPFWAKDPSIGSRMINARSESVATKPSFRRAFKKRRCLIPADGFYEWRGDKGHKQPVFLTLPDGGPFAFAGLWEMWDDKGSADMPYRSATILTRPASETVRPIHHRMPVILRPEAFDPWLDPDLQDPQRLQAILQNQIHTELRSVSVSNRVNLVQNNHPENIRPVDV